MRPLQLAKASRRISDFGIRRLRGFAQINMGKSHPKKGEAGKVFKLAEQWERRRLGGEFPRGILAGATPAVPRDAYSRAFLCVNRHLRITRPVQKK
jgi:hypothetical protein